MSLKVGDVVYVIWNSPLWKGVGVVMHYDVVLDYYRIEVNGRIGGFPLKSLIPIEIYESPLYKALQEEE